MKCTQYEQFERGKINLEAFHQHIQSCAECRENLQQDEFLLDAAASLNHHLDSPDLWPEIEQQLTEAKRNRTFLFPFLKIAVLFLIGASIAVYFYGTPQPQSKPLLSSKALQDVEKKENEYLISIMRLEKIAVVRMDDIDMNLALLYRDKLEIIDSQIEKCRDALKRNPANSHIRRYLLAALNEKKDTLKEILK